MIREYIKQSKFKINSYLKKYFFENKQIFHTINSSWGDKLSKKLLDFSNQGKMIRGGLVFLGHQSFGNKKITENQVKIASAMEIMHSSLLIHDDIMDRDEKRRGQITIHEYFKKIGIKNKLTDTEHFGISTAICLGDIGFFLAADILNSLQLETTIKNKIINLFNHEIMRVGLAQQYEILNTFSKNNINTKDILAIYKFKTARYTFSLPLKLGAISARANDYQLKTIDELGEKFGLIFQIQDDEIGIFGETTQTGKVVGSDIRENKKTLYYTNIFGKKTFPYQTNLKKMYNKKNINKKDINKIIQLLIKSGLHDKIIKQKNKLYHQGVKQINKLKTNKKTKKIYSELLEYNMTRRK